MFRAISKNILTSWNPKFILNNGCAQVAYKHATEINAVKLMGTIEHEVKRLQNGRLAFFLKTLNEDTSYCIHNVRIVNGQLLNMVEKRLAVDQRIYIGGKIQTETLMVENQKHQNVQILANELYFLESNPKITEESMDNLNEFQPNQLDQNSIEMMAFIGTDVRKDKNMCSFFLVTHFTKWKGKPDESLSNEYHRVVIRNNPEMLRIAFNLHKNDRVYINGFINYMANNYPDGKDYTNGFIQPTNLVKLRKFN